MSQPTFFGSTEYIRNKGSDLHRSTMRSLERIRASPDQDKLSNFNGQQPERSSNVIKLRHFKDLLISHEFVSEEAQKEEIYELTSALAS
mmetsp:Transcript_35733/g.54687  ORF Transcript_35733/g.54687 Transcript_35733/m.54687 type:complete len:89 (+) Transcript_35733:957-1223(+)